MPLYLIHYFTTKYKFWDYLLDAFQPNTIEPVGVDYDLALYDPNETELATADNWGNVDEHIREWVSEGGAYRARIYPYDNTFSQSDTYSLTVEISIAPFRKPQNFNEIPFQLVGIIC